MSAAARPPHSLSRAYFERLYAADPDPWGFATSPYERAKYAATVAALPRLHYRSGLEVGCSIGVLSRLLAQHCERFKGVDMVETALCQARARNADLEHAAFERCRLPGERPRGRFDLIVLSEVAYYWNEEDLTAVADWLRAAMSPGGDLVMVHWVRATDYPLSGDDAVSLMLQKLGDRWTILRADRTDDYRLDVVRRPS